MTRGGPGAVLVVLSMVLCACGPGEDISNAESPTPPSPSSDGGSDSPEVEPQNEAVGAYEEMWDVVVEASRTARSDHPELDKYAEGDAVEVVRLGMEGIDEPLEGAPEHDITVRSAELEDDPRSVKLRDCQDGSRWIPKGSSPSTEKNIRVDATVVENALSWKVSELRIQEPGTC